MRSVFFTVPLVLIVSACVSSSGGEVSLANWPYGHKSAVAITLEAETPSEVQLSSIASVLRGRGLNATFFVIAGYFQENPGALEEIRSFEVGSLAWMQRSWRGAEVTREFQQEEITKADAWLRKMGFAPTGYRAPFLKVNEDTYPILESLGYTYDASQWFGFHPYRVGGIIEIPLSLNYDLYWSDLSMSRSMVPTYLAFEESYNDDGLFTFYAHTNKVYLNMNNFTRFLDYARDRDVWFASTGEVADWWGKREELTLSVDGSRVTVTNKGLRAVSGATLLLKAGKTLKGAKEIKQRDGVTYAVLPELGPNSKIIMVLEK